MFSDYIQSTKLTSNEANNIFQNIFTNSHYGNDRSFLSTLRALCYDRIGDDTLKLIRGTYNYTESQVEENRNDRMISAICSSFDPFNTRNSISIVYSTARKEDARACMGLLETSFTEVYKDWKRIEKVTDFYRKSFDALCFVNEKTKSSVIFVDSMSIRKWHYLQCSIFAALPWYFNPKDGVTEDEMFLINSLRTDSAEDYISAINKIADKFDFRSIKIKSLLKGFETRFDRDRLDRVRERIQGVNRDINTYNDYIRDFLKNKADLETEELGLAAKISQSDGESEIMDYFLCNKNVDLIDVTTSEMSFIARGKILYYDEDMLITMLNNPNSYLYKPGGEDCSHIIPPDKMRMLLEEIFIENNLSINVCAAYKFELRGNVRTIGGYDFGEDYSAYLPNPHIDNFNCMGNYTRTINTLLANHNYISAIEQCIASAQSLNFADGAVIRAFMSIIYQTGYTRYNQNFIQLPDGRAVCAKEAIEWLEAQKVKEEAADSDTEVFDEDDFIEEEFEMDFDESEDSENE